MHHFGAGTCATVSLENVGDLAGSVGLVLGDGVLVGAPEDASLAVEVDVDGGI